MEYKLIKKFLPELAIIDNNEDVPDYVEASDLESALAKGVEFFGLYNVYPINLSLDKHVADTHSGLLIGYQPIESSKPVSREEIDKVMQDVAFSYDDQIALALQNLFKRILENGVK